MVSDEFISYVLDQLSGFGEVTPRKMFGGAGLYHDGLMFALIANDILYFKVDVGNRGDYESAGSEPFRPYPDKNTVMSYYEVPIDVSEDRDELASWAQAAFEAAIRARKA
jgi:DNA transformation protein